MTKFEDPFQNLQARYLVVAGVLTKPEQHEGETSQRAEGFLQSDEIFFFQGTMKTVKHHRWF